MRLTPVEIRGWRAARVRDYRMPGIDQCVHQKAPDVPESTGDEELQGLAARDARTPIPFRARLQS